MEDEEQWLGAWSKLPSYVLNDNWIKMTYGMPIEGRESGVSCQPQVRATYKVEALMASKPKCSLPLRYETEHEYN
ncbi:hypothetical protein O9993_18850 [Vibrio lentus]|nr:hypothetical protein [Vibrio lentus]